jgi:curved DNA-binding protein CbpA
MKTGRPPERATDMRMNSLGNNDQTYYELLEVSPSAGPTEIYQAYQRAKSTYSPSSPALYTMFTAEEAAQLMSLIEEAYQTLSNKTRRHDYDVSIGLVKASRPHHSAGLNQHAPVVPLTTSASPKPEENWISEVKVLKKRDDLPKGFARTRFSVYEVKPEIEDEIKNVQECDGQFLQKIRLYKGVNLDQLSEEIKVSKSTLVALEANDIEALPIAVFTRGFVIQFAKILNINEKQLSEAYMKYFRAKKVVEI